MKFSALIEIKIQNTSSFFNLLYLYNVIMYAIVVVDCIGIVGKKVVENTPLFEMC